MLKISCKLYQSVPKIIQRVTLESQWNNRKSLLVTTLCSDLNVKSNHCQIIVQINLQFNLANDLFIVNRDPNILILWVEVNAEGSTFERNGPDDVAVPVDDLHRRHESVDNCDLTV